MRLKFCCICGVTNNLHHHHIIPRSRGGTNDETNYLTLCGKHHGWIHSRRPNSWNSHLQLIKEGQERARKQGKQIGRPRISIEKVFQIKELRSNGLGMNKIAKTLGVGNSQVYRICKYDKL